MTFSARFGFGVSGVVIGLALLVGASVLPPPRPVGHFSAAKADSNGHPAAWRPIEFGDVDVRTRYRLVKRSLPGGTTTVVRATSRGGAAGLGRPLQWDPHRHPILTWTWSVSNVLDSGNAFTKDGDDYPARLYVTFDYDPDQLGWVDRAKYAALQALGYDDVPTRALNYVWANRVPTDTVFPNACTDWVQMIPVRSGSPQVGTWTRERRNVRADYRRAFGEPPPPIDGVAIMTDTDNTGASATAYYGDIVARADPDTTETPRKGDRSP